MFKCKVAISIALLKLLIHLASHIHCYPTADTQSVIVGEGHPLFDLIGYSIDQKLQLLYKATKDGFGQGVFHSKCDGKKQTLTLIKTSQGYICGGYAELAWQSNGALTTDPNAFIFSLTNPENRSFVIKPVKGVNALYFDQNSGPYFGHDLFISVDSNVNTASYIKLGQDYTLAKLTGIVYTMPIIMLQALNFQVSEIEVYESDMPLKGDGVSPYPPLSSLILGSSKTIFSLISVTPSTQFTLLYRATSDGFGAAQFHAKCDAHAYTVTIMKTVSTQAWVMQYIKLSN